MAREGIHPETPRTPYTPGWDLVGVVDALGDGVTGFDLGQPVAAMPISGSYAEYVCLESNELVRIPDGLDPAEAVSLVLNYITAYQMLHRSASAKSGQSILIHGASGGVGTALLQLGRLAGQSAQGIGTVGTTAATRRPGEGPAGFFINLLPLPLELAGRPTLRQLLARTREAVDAAVAVRYLPYQHMAALRPDGEGLFRVFFQVLGMPPFRLAGIKSWTLHPDVEVILLGEEEGLAEVARELGVRNAVVAAPGDDGLLITLEEWFAHG